MFSRPHLTPHPPARRRTGVLEDFFVPLRQVEQQTEPGEAVLSRPGTEAAEHLIRSAPGLILESTRHFVASESHARASNNGRTTLCR